MRCRTLIWYITTNLRQKKLGLHYVDVNWSYVLNLWSGAYMNPRSFLYEKCSGKGLFLCSPKASGSPIPKLLVVHSTLNTDIWFRSQGLPFCFRGYPRFCMTLCLVRCLPLEISILLSGLANHHPLKLVPTKVIHIELRLHLRVFFFFLCVSSFGTIVLLVLVAGVCVWLSLCL